MIPGASATALRSADWAAFAPPYRGWEHSISRIEALAEIRITAAVSSAREGSLSTADSAWFNFLRDHMQVSAFVSKEAERALHAAASMCPWPEVARCLELQAQTQARQAQAVVLYAVDLEDLTGAMPVEGARDRWLDDPVWQPARTYLADAAALEDWGETVVAMNLCFEPLIGQLLLREFGVGASLVHGDQVTPAVAEAGLGEWEWTRDWTLALVCFVLADDAHGDSNRERIDHWLTAWNPRAHEAAAGIAELANGLPHPVDPAAALARVAAEQRRLAVEAGVGVAA